MGFAFFKRIFGGSPEKSGSLPPIVETEGEERCNSEKSQDAQKFPILSNFSDLPQEVQETTQAVKTFVEYVVKALVDEPGQVTFTFVQKVDLTVLQIHCFKKDIGKIIGKQGKTIGSLRLLVNGIGARYGHRITVDVMDD